MPSRDTSRIALTIAHNINLARQFIKGLSYEEFASDERTIYAVTRCLEIVSEASRRLPAEVKARYPTVRWDQIAGAGNIYRHDYEDVLPRILWTTVRDHLSDLEAAVRSEQ
jgi:uncharacterized protein with HEPN domain